MKRRAFLHELANAGCQLKRHGKRHDLYINPKNGKVAPVPWFSAAGRFELPAMFAAAKKLKQATGALGGLGRKAPKAPEDQLTAVWLEYVTADPGGRSERVRREVFDLLGIQREMGKVPRALSLSAADGRDRGLALLGRTSSLVLSCTPHPVAVEQAALENWSNNRNAFIALVYQAAGWEDERVPIALQQAEFRPVDLMAMASLREIWSRHQDFIHLDRTNVLSTHLIQAAQGDTTELLFATDIVIHRLGVLPRAPLDPRLIRLEQGVLDTLVETAFSTGQEVHNTYLHFAERSNESGDWIAISPDRSTDEALEGLPAGDRSRMRSAIGHGNLVVASPVPYTLGDHQFASWWRIDASDGTTLGLGYRGWGTETGEYAPVQTVATAGTGEASRQVGRKVACKAATATLEVLTEVTGEWVIPDEMRAYDRRYSKFSPERKALIRKIKRAAPKC